MLMVLCVARHKSKRHLKCKLNTVDDDVDDGGTELHCHCQHRPFCIQLYDRERALECVCVCVHLPNGIRISYDLRTIFIYTFSNSRLFGLDTIIRAFFPLFENRA